MNSRDDLNRYQLAWSEEFEGDSLCSADWNIETHEAGWVNHELQKYIASEETVFIKDGMLHIRPIKITDKEGNHKFYSGRVNTKDKHEFLYGKFEASMKVPRGKGFLPAFWLLADEERFGNWPLCGEVDIMEVLGDRTDKVYGTIHYGEKHIMKQGWNLMMGNEDLSAGFHLYGCEWDPEKIAFFIDGIEYFRVSINEPFTHPFYIIINLAVGGDWPGDPDVNTPFDDRGEFVIDYIKVYRKEVYSQISFGDRRKVIGICGVWEDAENLNMFLKSMQTKALLRDYVLSCYTFGIPSDDRYNIDRELEFADFVCGNNTDALIIFGEMIKTNSVIERLVSNCHERDIPVFMFERMFPGTIQVVLNYDEGFEKVVRHVIEHHKKTDAEMFAGFRGNPFSESRIEIFKKVLKENGIPFEQKKIHYGDFWDAIASHLLNGLIKSGYKVPGAFICANDSMAIGVCDCLGENGFKVPDDVIVTGFDGIILGKYHSPTLTTCELDYENIANIITDRIDRWYSGEDHDKLLGEQISIDYKMALHGSCCKELKDEADPAEVIAELSRDNHDYFRHMIEMGKFISRTISMSDVDQAAYDLQRYLWLWKDQYYFIGLQEGEECLHALFELNDGEYRFDQKFYNMPDYLPEMDRILSRKSKINVLLIKQTRSGEKSFGYVVTGFEKVDLRKQQRFEEFALFVSTMVNSVLNNAQTQETVEQMGRMSELDYLTGLYNRRGFFNSIDRMLGDKRNKSLILSLFSADMDGLKGINDSFGHHEGDNAIQILSRAISKYVGENGVCARYGGDEFAFAIVGDEPLYERLDQIRREIRRYMNEDEGLIGKQYSLDVSIGISEQTINRSIDIEEMIRESDAMMYRSKLNKHHTS